MSEIDRRIAEVAAGQHGVVAGWQLHSIGIGHRAIGERVADRRLRRVHRGVYAHGQTPITRRAWWMAAVLTVGREAVLSHHDAAAALDLREPHNGDAHVSTPLRRRSRRGVIVHQAALLRPDDFSVIDAIPVTSVPRTLLDMATVLDARALRRMWERAEELQALDVMAVRALVVRANGHRGLGALCRLLRYDPSAAARAESELERLFLELLREAGLPLPQVNVLVGGFLVDAYWPEARLVVELDGYEFHSDRDAFERDHEKRVALRRSGLTVVEFTYRQAVDRPAWVVGVVREELAQTLH